MRYTTCIDISEFPSIYGNLNARLVYFHLCLKSGYHDDDRDQIHVSLRRLADEVGITLSALRHALKILEAMSFIRIECSTIYVKKWVDEKPITKRARMVAMGKAKDETRRREAEQKERDNERREDARRREELESNGVSSFIVYYEKRIEEYQRGDVDALSSLKRNKNMYLRECERMKHEPIKIEI